MAIAERLGELVEARDVVVLTGDLGAGKTRFAKGLGFGLDIDEPVTSPTFNILLVHRGRLPLYHVDLYRLDTADQLDDIDWWGVVEGDGVSVVEWGDRFPDMLPADYLELVLHITGDDTRRIEVRSLGGRSAGLAREWMGALGDVEAAEVVDAT